MTRAFRVVVIGALFSAQIYAQQQVEVHLRPAVGQILTAQQEEDFLGAVTFGKRYYEAGDLSSSFERLTAAEQILPGHPAVLYNVAVVLAKLGRFADAQNKIETYKALFPGGEEMALIRALQIDLDWSRDAKRRAQENQTYIELFNRARFSFDSGDHSQALARFKQAEQLKPDDAPAAFNQAVCLEALGDYTGAIERLRHFLSLDAGSEHRSSVDEKINLLTLEVDDQRNRILCGFCGRKLSASGAWCPDCGHGPFLPQSAQWNSRSCATGASATRTTSYPSGRLHQNEDLPCLYEGSYATALRYTAPRRLAIQAARKTEGWTFESGRISAFKDRDSAIALKQDGEHLSRIDSPSSGDWLKFSGQMSGNSRWLVGDEERILNGQRYRKRYVYDESGRISRETVQYQGANRCGNIIETSADWIYEGDRLKRIALQGGYEGYLSEGSPKVHWAGTVTFSYDENGLLLQEELALESWTKTFAKMPGEARRMIERYYPGHRGKAVDMLQKGDICGVAGTQVITNLIDLRAFDAWSPNLALVLPPGITRATVSFTYPEGYTFN